MAGYKYYTILTDIGKKKLVEAISNESPIDFTEIAIGDANGVSYDPTGEETALKHEVFKKAIDSVSIDSIDKNIMIFEMVVPASSGGYYMRESGLFASDGTLIAIARIAEQYKPLLEEGAGVSITISMRIAISSDAQVYINIPESINYATQNYVQEELKKHKAEKNPHAQYVILDTYNEEIYEQEQALASKADSNHRHDDLYSNINHAHSNYAASNHNHDATYLKKTDVSSTYATKTEMNNGLAGKAASNHNHDGVYLKNVPTNSIGTGHLQNNAVTSDKVNMPSLMGIMFRIGGNTVNDNSVIGSWSIQGGGVRLSQNGSYFNIRFAKDGNNGPSFVWVNAGGDIPSSSNDIVLVCKIQ